MNEFNLVFKCEFGEYKLERCKKLPNKEELEEAMENLMGVGLGKTKQIIIEPVSK